MKSRSSGTLPASMHERSIAMGFSEFVVLCAALMSTQALAVDAMLPALPRIVRALGVIDENRGQWVVVAYITGVGVGQLFWGLLSDRFGRRPILLGGLAIYLLAAAACGLSGGFNALLTWRFLHGVAAASLVVTRSVIRDLYSGRRMARVMSLTFMVFLMVPVIAPSIGQLMLWFAPWRAIFNVLAAYSAAVWLWAFLRLPETLHPEYRLTLTRAHVRAAVRLVLGNRISICYTAAGACVFGSVVAYVGMVEQIFDAVFHHAAWMPTMFALCAAFMGVASFFNSRIVERAGMRRISHIALLALIGITLAHVGVAALGMETMWTFVALQAVTMACVSLSVSNFGAIAMEPVGAVAGIGASLQGFISTFGAALLGAVIGRTFGGTTLPLAVGALSCALGGLAFVLTAEKWRLFGSQTPHFAAAAAHE